MATFIAKSAEFLGSTSSRSWRLCTIAALLFAVFVTVSMLMMSSNYVVTVFPPDLAAFFDAAWRVQCGQIPHTDFFSHIGALIPYLFAFVQSPKMSEYKPRLLRSSFSWQGGRSTQ